MATDFPSRRVLGPLVAFVLVVAGSCAPFGDLPAPYGVKIAFRAGSPIRFRHFELTFLGERDVTSPQYPRAFHYYDFRVNSGSETRTVSWSSGTGEIAPSSFTVGGRSFLLELRHSERRGKLRENELVVTRAPGPPWPRPATESPGPRPTPALR